MGKCGGVLEGWALADKGHLEGAIRVAAVLGAIDALVRAGQV